MVSPGAVPLLPSDATEYHVTYEDIPAETVSSAVAMVTGVAIAAVVMGPSVAVSVPKTTTVFFKIYVKSSVLVA